MFETSYLIFTSMRPRQWLKNLAVFAALFFGGRFFELGAFRQVSLTFLIFCLLSSGVYLINDCLDYEADKIHFSKQKRPIAAGLISKKLAFSVSLVLLILGLIFSFYLSQTLFFTSLIFVIIQFLYSLFLKEILILDIMAIAFAFMTRVFAGSFVINEPLSSWLILSVMMLSLFLAVGKRRSELTLLTYQQATAHRKILSHYPISLIDSLTVMMATASLITYSLFTFNTGRFVNQTIFSTLLPSTVSNSKWLMITVPFVVYGIFRYLYLIFEKKEGESPERILLSDLPLFTTIVTWLGVIFVLIYVFNL